MADPLNLDAIAASLALPCVCQDDPPPCTACRARAVVTEQAALFVGFASHVVWLADRTAELRTKAETPLVFIDVESLGDMLRAILAGEARGGLSHADGTAKCVEIDQMIRAGCPYSVATIGYGRDPAREAR